MFHEYGLTHEQYMQIADAQGNVCAICKEVCKSGRQLAVDHDHGTGALRALLSANCNRALGLFQEDPSLLDRAAEYLREHHPIGLLIGTGVA